VKITLKRKRTYLVVKGSPSRKLTLETKEEATGNIALN